MAIWSRPAPVEGAVEDGHVRDTTVVPGRWVFGDADGVIFLPTGDQAAVRTRAEEPVAR